MSAVRPWLLAVVRCNPLLETLRLLGATAGGELTLVEGWAVLLEAFAVDSSDSCSVIGYGEKYLRSKKEKKIGCGERGGGVGDLPSFDLPLAKVYIVEVAPSCDELTFLYVFVFTAVSVEIGVVGAVSEQVGLAPVDLERVLSLVAPAWWRRRVGHWLRSELCREFGDPFVKPLVGVEVVYKDSIGVSFEDIREL